MSNWLAVARLSWAVPNGSGEPFYVDMVALRVQFSVKGSGGGLPTFPTLPSAFRRYSLAASSQRDRCEALDQRSRGDRQEC